MTAPFHLNFTRWNSELKLRQKYALRWLTRKWRNKEQFVYLTLSIGMMAVFFYNKPNSYSTTIIKRQNHLPIYRNEEYLLATMANIPKELFLRYADCIREFQTMTEFSLFQKNFKFGAKMMLEVMEEQLNS